MGFSPAAIAASDQSMASALPVDDLSVWMRPAHGRLLNVLAFSRTCVARHGNARPLHASVGKSMVIQGRGQRNLKLNLMVSEHCQRTSASRKEPMTCLITALPTMPMQQGRRLLR